MARDKASVIEGGRTWLTHRERFQRLMHFQTVDRGVHWEFGYLGETVDRWHQEGLGAQYKQGNEIEGYFGVDPTAWIPINNGLHPGFDGETKRLKHEGNKATYQSPDGTVYEEVTEGVHTIPHYIKMPIENRDDWTRFKERLQPDTPGRCTVDFRKEAERLRNINVPVGVSLGSFLGWIRNWVGFENLALMVYDDRELVEEMVETCTQLFISQLTPALREIRADFAGGWEDICFRSGPLLSPTMFGEIVIPRVKRVCDLLRQHGCDVIWTDCDGDVTSLVPLWLDAGLNCMFPLEVHPGSDPVKYRKMFGRRVLLVGGIAKYQLALGKKEILAELKRVEKIVEDGGFIPHGDHRIPQDVPYENYRYYIREKLTMLGWPKYEIDAIEPLRGVK